MKKIYLLLLLSFFCNSSTAQTEIDTNAVAPIERWSLRFGQKMLHNWNSEGSGIVLRLSTGTRRCQNNPIVIPVDLEVAYKFHFVELGLRHSPAALPLGRGFSSSDFGFGNSNTDAWPRIATLKSTGWNLGIHFKVRDTPFFIRYGQMYYRSSSEVRTITNVSAQQSNVSWTPNFFLPTDTNIMNRNRFHALSFGIEYGNFWTGLDFQTLRIKYPNAFGSVSTLNFVTWTVGAQIGAGPATALEQLKAKKRVVDHFWMIGINRLNMSVLRANSAAASGYSIETSWRLKPCWRIGLRYVDVMLVYGRDFRKPTFVNTDWGASILSDYFDRLTENTTFFALQVEYQKPTEKPFQWVLMTGVNRYQLIPDDLIAPTFFPESPPIPSTENIYGLSIGSGFNYKFLQSRLIFHKPFGRKMMVEWNMGARFGFF